MATTTMPAPASAPRPLKLLMLHGYTQSGALFRAKTRALEKQLQRAQGARGGVALHYATAPLALVRADLAFGTPPAPDAAAASPDEQLDAWAWWRRKGDDPATFVYDGIDRGLARVAHELRAHGPFDGVVGFSQGAACAAMVAALLEPGRRDAFAAHAASGGMPFPESFMRQGWSADGETSEEAEAVHPPLKFAVIYSGFAAVGPPTYRAFYEPKIRTPTLHFLGSLDTIVDEKRSMALVDACEPSTRTVVNHPGGHFLPNQAAYVNALIRFIESVMASTGEDGGKREQPAEDMDVPF